MTTELKNNSFSAQIDSLGAQLVSLKDRTEKEYIWQRDSAYWQYSSPLLFPGVGNCRDGRTIIEGKEYELSKHGFCKITDFSIEKRSDSSAVLTICDSPDTRRVYPYAFRLSVTYTLTEKGITIDYRVKNMDSRPIYFQIGAHPGFNCPLNPGEAFEDYVLEFDKEETAASLVYDSTKLQFDLSRRKLLLAGSRILPLGYDLFLEDAVFFPSIRSRLVKLVNPNTGKGIQVDFKDFESIAFWTSMPTKGPFLCIEPRNGTAICSDEDNEFKNRRFIQRAGIGEEKKYHLEISVL